MKSSLSLMQTFTINTIPDLDVCVLAALELFSKIKPIVLVIPYQKPLVVGSVNAAATGRILFEDVDAVFADESTFEQKLKHIQAIDGVVLISASGGKHAPLIAKCSKHYKKHITLITNNHTAIAKEYLDNKHKYDCYLFPKNREPYTYNTSTYLGMILAKTKENPQRILHHIQTIKPKIPKNLHHYNAFCIIIPPQFELIREMFQTKFDELFGPMIVGRIFTSEQIKHAKTVIPSDKELFIGLGFDNTIYGKHKFNITLPPKPDYAAIMALGYYIIGHIQKQHPPYFKKNIENYARQASKLFHQDIKPIVE